MYKYEICFSAGHKIIVESEVEPSELLGVYFKSTGENDKLSFGYASVVVKNGDVSYIREVTQ